MHIRTHPFIHIHMHGYTVLHMLIHTRRMFTCMHVHTGTHPFIHTHTQIRMDPYPLIPTYVYTDTHPFIHTYTNTHGSIPTHSHIRVHGYTPIHSHIHSCSHSHTPCSPPLLLPFSPELSSSETPSKKPLSPTLVSWARLAPRFMAQSHAVLPGGTEHSGS